MSRYSDYDNNSNEYYSNDNNTMQSAMNKSDIKNQYKTQKDQSQYTSLLNEADFNNSLIDFISKDIDFKEIDAELRSQLQLIEPFKNLSASNQVDILARAFLIMQKQKELLKREVHTIKSDHEVLISELKEKYKVKLNRYHNDNCKLKSTIQILEETIEKYKNSDYEAKIKTMESKIISLKTRLQWAEDDKNETMTDYSLKLKNSNDKYALLKKENDSMIQSLKEYDKSKKSSDEELNKLKAELIVLKDELKNTERERARLEILVKQAEGNEEIKRPVLPNKFSLNDILSDDYGSSNITMNSNIIKTKDTVIRQIHKVPISFKSNAGQKHSYDDNSSDDDIKKPKDIRNLHNSEYSNQAYDSQLASNNEFESNIDSQLQVYRELYNSNTKNILGKDSEDFDSNSFKL